MPWTTQITFEPPLLSWKNVLDPCMIEIYTFTGFFFFEMHIKIDYKKLKKDQVLNTCMRTGQPLA